MTQSDIIKTYTGSDVGASQCLVTLEGFIGDMDNAELADDSTVDTSDAVTAINGLIWSLEQRDAEIERLRPLAEAVRALRAERDRLKGVINFVESWVSNPMGAYSVSALDGLFGMTRDKIAALPITQPTIAESTIATLNKVAGEMMGALKLITAAYTQQNGMTYITAKCTTAISHAQEAGIGK